MQQFDGKLTWIHSNPERMEFHPPRGYYAFGGWLLLLSGAGILYGACTAFLQNNALAFVHLLV